MSQVSKTIKLQVGNRARFACEYCQSQWRFSPYSFSVEHIWPTSKGGNSDLENLALSCANCNACKYTHTHAIDPLTGETVPLFHLRNDVWVSHFEWSEDLLTIRGLTSIGRATIKRLKFNSPEHLNLRQVLVRSGNHPPRFVE